jgi:hypothetical protein
MNSNIYWERQRGDLCRLHSINAYFGFKKIDESEFFKWCDKYDNIIKGLKTQGMDGFSEGRCIISYILEQMENTYVFLIPMNSYNGVRNDIDIDRYNKLIPKLWCYFEFNKGHVWLNKKHNGQWYKIDSISGVNRIDSPTIKNNGYLLVIDGKHLYNEINYYLELVKNINSEVTFINLYYSLKLIKLNKIGNDNEYNKKIILLNKIYKQLVIFVKQNRENKNTDENILVIIKWIKLLNPMF